MPKTGEATFYLSLPSSTTGLSDAAAKVATPGSSNYRHFSSLATAAGQFGATDAQINPQNHRAVPDVSALADIVPGWPDVIDSVLQPVGGTSGSTPFIAAAAALVDGSERAAGRPRIGLANGWFYKAASQPGAFFDITAGNNDLAGVGCCQATVGYDLASGLGVPNWAALSATLPQPG